MELVENEIFQRPAAPGLISPGKGTRIDDCRRTMNALRLKTREWIRAHPLAIEQVKISAARPSSLDRYGVHPIRISLHAHRLGVGRDKTHSHLPYPRRPYPKTH